MVYKIPRALFWAGFFVFSGPQLIWSLNNYLLRNTECAAWGLLTREAVFGALFCLQMHSLDFVWTFSCMYYRQFVVEEKFGFNTSSTTNFCISLFLNDFLLMLLRNVANTLVATAVIFYGSTNLSEIVYHSLIVGVTNLLVFIDCFGVMQLLNC